MTTNVLLGTVLALNVVQYLARVPLVNAQPGTAETLPSLVLDDNSLFRSDPRPAVPEDPPSNIFFRRRLRRRRQRRRRRRRQRLTQTPTLAPFPGKPPRPPAPTLTRPPVSSTPPTCRGDEFTLVTLILIDAANDRPLQRIQNDAVITLSDYPTSELTMEVIYSPVPASVRLVYPFPPLLTDTVDNDGPFTLQPVLDIFRFQQPDYDPNDPYEPAILRAGEWTLQTTAFCQPNARGAASATTSFRFTVQLQRPPADTTFPTGAPTSLPTSSPRSPPPRQRLPTPAPSVAPTTPPPTPRPTTPRPSTPRPSSPAPTTPRPTTAPPSSSVLPTAAPSSPPTPRAPPLSSPPTTTPPISSVPTPAPSRSPRPSPAPSAAPSRFRRPTIRPAPPSQVFNIELLNMGNNTDFDAEFQRAADRWEQIIVGDLPDVANPTIDIFAGFFDEAVVQPIDDVVIGFEFLDFGTDSTIGRAGPTATRQGNGVPINTAAGIMQFNTRFFSSFSSDDAYAVILHEMAHVLGYGSFWTGRCGGDCPNDGFLYSCDGANNAYLELNLEAPVGTPNLLLANDGGEGSICGHWDDDSFNDPTWSELMTPFFDEDKIQLITTVTVASLQDLGGYEVDFTAADAIPTPQNMIRPPGFGAQTTFTFSLEGRIIRIFPPPENSF